MRAVRSAESCWPLLIHAGGRWDAEPVESIEMRHSVSVPRDVSIGGIVGIADLVDIVKHSDDGFFTGPFGWILANARALPFRPMSGKLGLFEVL